MIFALSVIVVSLFVCGWFVSVAASGRTWRMGTPFAVLNLSFVYYACLGPIYLLSKGSLQLGSIALDDNIGTSALGALIAYLSAAAAYFIRVQILPPPAFRRSHSNQATAGIAVALHLVFWSAALVAMNGNLPALYNVAGENEFATRANLGGAEVYLYMMMSGMIAPIAMMMLQASARYGAVIFLMAFNASIIFVATGFRIRLALIFLSLASCLLLRTLPGQMGETSAARGQKSPWFRIVLVFAMAIGALSVMSIARKYGKGVDMQLAAQATGDELAAGFFKDTSIYFVGGRAMVYVEEMSAYTYFQTAVDTLIRAVPSSVYGFKPVPATQQTIQNAMGGDKFAITSGFAVPYYVEHFMCFGWFGLVVGSMLVGSFCAAIENAAYGGLTVYSATALSLVSAYVFMFFHRGYLPQQVDFFMFFVVVPLMALAPFRYRFA